MNATLSAGLDRAALARVRAKYGRVRDEWERTSLLWRLEDGAARQTEYLLKSQAKAGYKHLRLAVRLTIHAMEVEREREAQPVPRPARGRGEIEPQLVAILNAAGFGFGVRHSLCDTYETLDELLDATPSDVARIRLIGAKKLADLQAALARDGLSLAHERVNQ